MMSFHCLSLCGNILYALVTPLAAMKEDLGGLHARPGWNKFFVAFQLLSYFLLCIPCLFFPSLLSCFPPPHPSPPCLPLFLLILCCLTLLSFVSATPFPFSFAQVPAKAPGCPLGALWYTNCSYIMTNLWNLFRALSFSFSNLFI